MQPSGFYTPTVNFIPPAKPPSRNNGGVVAAIVVLVLFALTMIVFAFM